MAAPHVTGSIAVLQGAARARLGRRLTPDEVEAVLTRSTAPMGRKDALYDFPCADQVPGFQCGADVEGTTNAPYARWQVGAGALHVGSALAAIGQQPAASPPPALPPGLPPPPPPSNGGLVPAAAPAPAAKKTKKKRSAKRKSTRCRRRAGRRTRRATARRCAAKKRKATAKKRRKTR
jgi:hypothetical protein